MSANSAGRSALSPTTAALLEQERQSAELLIGWVRIAIAVALASAFALAVLPFAPTDDPMLAGQIAIAFATFTAYLCVGIVSVALGRAGRATARVALALAGFDILFVLISLAIGIANAGIPSDYLVSLPVAWLLPVMIGLGALRLRTNVAIGTMLFVVVGLVATAQIAAPFVGGTAVAPPAQIGVFFAAPPNVMRLLMLAGLSVIVVTAVARSYRLLLRATEEERRRQNLTRYLPAELADRLAGGELAELRQGRRLTVCLMFCDIRGFTRVTEAMEPRAVAALVTDYRRHVREIAERFGGVIDKFIGDGALIVFGLPEPRPGDAVRAVACARRLAGRNRLGGRELTIVVGAHRGDAFCGVVGDAQRVEFTVLGDAVNVAQRIQAMTREFEAEILVSRNLIDAADGGEAAERHLPAVSIRGRAHPVDLVTMRPKPAP